MPPLLSKIDSLSSIKFLLFRPHNVFNSTNVLWMTIWEHRNSVWSSINLETKPSSNIYGAKLILSNWHLIVIVLPYQAQLCSSYPRLSVAEGATALCGIAQPSFFNKLKPITRAGIKWKERVTVTIKQPTLSSYCQNPRAHALCGPGLPMDKQSSTQAPIIIFVSIQSFPNRIGDWSYNSK